MKGGNEGLKSGRKGRRDSGKRKDMDGEKK